jgi:hypothetical protein
MGPQLVPTFQRRKTTAAAAVGNGNTVPEPSIPGAKRPAREGERSPSGAEVNKNKWRYTPTASIHLHAVDRNNFAFSQTYHSEEQACVL